VRWRMSIYVMANAISDDRHCNRRPSCTKSNTY